MQILDVLIRYNTVISLARSQGVLNHPTLSYIEGDRDCFYQLCVLPEFSGTDDISSIPSNDDALDAWLDRHSEFENFIKGFGRADDIIERACRSVEKIDDYERHVSQLVEQASTPNFDL